MKKLLLAIDEFSATATGGANYVVWRLAQQLKHHYTVAVLTTHRRGIPTYKQVEGIEIHSIPIDYPERFRAYLSLYNPTISAPLKKILADVKPDIVHAHTIHTYLTYHFLKLAKDVGAKVVFTGHDVMPVFYGRLTQFMDNDRDGIFDTLDTKVHFFKQAWEHTSQFNPLRNVMIRNYLNNVCTVTVSQALKEVYKENGIQVDAVIHNGIDIQNWQATEAEVNKFRLNHHLNGKKVIFYGGRIRQDKGSLQAVKILEKLPDNTILLVAGQRRDLIDMQTLAKRYGLSQRPICPGFLKQDQLKVTYHASDIVLVPSICFDSFPNVVLEGMAAKKVVIATQFGGAKEAITDGEDGFIINPFDVNGVVKLISPLIQDSKKMKAIGTNAYKTVIRRFRIEDQVNQYLRLYHPYSNRILTGF